MLASINLVANAIIFAGSLWAVLTHKVPTRTGGALILAFVNFASLGNMVVPGTCHSTPEIALNAAVAVGVVWGFWRLELRCRVQKGGAT
jgi:hypothetical protein